MMDPYRMIEMNAEAEFEKINKEQEELISSIEKSLKNQRPKENPFIFSGKTIVADSFADDIKEDAELNATSQSNFTKDFHPWFDD